MLVGSRPAAKALRSLPAPGDAAAQALKAISLAGSNVRAFPIGIPVEETDF